MKARPFTQTLTRILILLDALIWLGFAIITALDLHPALPEGNIYRWIISSLALAASLGLVVLLFLMLRGLRFAYYLLFTALLIISILTITDDFGLPDLIVLIINLGAMVLLLLNRKIFFKSKEN